jgi:hypothetical protein
MLSKLIDLILLRSETVKVLLREVASLQEQNLRLCDTLDLILKAQQNIVESCKNNQMMIYQLDDQQQEIVNHLTMTDEVSTDKVIYSEVEKTFSLSPASTTKKTEKPN